MAGYKSWQDEPFYWAPQKKLGGGWLCFKSSPSPPPAPDYAGAANATAAGNLEAARANAAANRVNQVTPYGNLTYTRDPNAATPDDGWTVTQTLAPDQQQLLNQQNKTSLGLAGLADEGLGYVKGALNNNITMDSLPANMVNPGQTGQDALMARFQPQIDQSRKALETQLANQGIMQGSEAYDNAMRVQNQSENDLRTQAALNGISVGQNAQNQQLQLQTALQNQPLNMLNAVRTGSQVTNPSFSNVPMQPATAGPDLLGAANAQNQYNMGLYNSQVASGNSAMGGLFGLGAAGLGAYGMMNMPVAAAASDRRVKENIIQIGKHLLGIGVYLFSYKPEYQDEHGHGLKVGVMADEVEKVKPEAVSLHKDGYKLVNYAMLGA